MDFLSPKKRLYKKFDKIKEREENKTFKESGNRSIKKLFSNKLTTVGLVIFTVILLACICAPLLTKYDPLSVDMKNILKPPSSDHILGTDKIGRDIFSRILYGGRLSILIGFGSALGCSFIGVILGCYSGYKGGILDKILVRISEIFMSFPQLILVLMLVSIIGQSASNIVIIFIICGWGSVFRMARSQILSIREEEYVQSLKVFGLNDFIICYKHMLPNIIGPIAVNITLSTAMFILEEELLAS